MKVSKPQADVPMPPKGGPRRGSLADQFRRLQVGESVLVRGRSQTDGLHGYWKHLHDPFGWRMHFTTRKTVEGVRVWRTA
jgi:hypothetical protein